MPCEKPGSMAGPQRTARVAAALEDGDAVALAGHVDEIPRVTVVAWQILTSASPRAVAPTPTVRASAKVMAAEATTRRDVAA